MKINALITSAALLALVNPVFAAISYQYKYDLAPGFNAALYLDDKAGFTKDQVNTPYTTTGGDLNDGIIAAGDPTINPDMIAWIDVPTPATITIDLGGIYDITSIDITTFAFFGFQLGHPDDVSISVAGANEIYTADPSATIFTNTGGDQAQLQSITRTDTGVQFIQLAFDGDTTFGDKWGLTEIAIEGTAAVPEPSSTALIGLGGLALFLRRRR